MTDIHMTNIHRYIHTTAHIIGQKHTHTTHMTHIAYMCVHACVYAKNMKENSPFSKQASFWRPEGSARPVSVDPAHC